MNRFTEEKVVFVSFPFVKSTNYMYVLGSKINNENVT